MIFWLALVLVLVLSCGGFLLGWYGMIWDRMGWDGMDLSAILSFLLRFLCEILFFCYIWRNFGMGGGIDDGMGWGIGGIDTGNICGDRQNGTSISSSGSFLCPGMMSECMAEVFAQGAGG
jgi:hypothetical protein